MCGVLSAISHSAPLGWRSRYVPRGIFRTHSTPQQWSVVVTCEARHPTPSPLERGRGLVLPPREASPVHPLPLGKAYADKSGFVAALKEVVPTARAVDPGPSVLGLRLDTLSGRSPLERWAAFLTHPATALLVGQAVVPEAFQDDTVGRVLDRL